MKKLLTLFILLIIGLGSAGIYSMTQDNIEELIVCTSNEKASYIPAIVCETYLLNYRGHAADIQFLKNRTGINFLTNIENTARREMLFEFFISKGMDINTVSIIDGLTPLHAAVLLNDPELVRFLLKKGANKRVRERTNGLTPLEFLTKMDAQLPGIDRQSVRTLLE